MEEQDAVLSQGGPHDAAVNFDRCLRIEFYSSIVRFLCHSTVFLLVWVCLQTAVNCLSKSDKY